MRTSRKMAARHCPRPFWLGTLKYYADRIAGAVTYLPLLRPGRVYYIIYARTVGDKRHRADENGSGDIARLDFVFEEFLISLAACVPETRLSALRTGRGLCGARERLLETTRRYVHTLKTARRRLPP